MQQVPRSFVIKTGILNPSIQSLLCRVRHTNLLVIADRGFPFWADIETIDISLVDDVPQVTQVMEAVLQNFQVGRAWMASEFIAGNSARQVARTRALLGSVPLEFVSHLT
jgi:D-ribose pyranase